MDKHRWIATVAVVASCAFFIGRARSTTVAGAPVCSSESPAREATAKVAAVARPPTRELERPALAAMLGNLSTLSRSARVVPEVRAGRAAGMRLYSVQADGALGLLGFHNGDVVTAVNGLELASPEQALALYATLKSATHLRVDLERGGERITQEYVVR